MEKTEIEWNNFKMSVELHRSYLDVAIKLNMFYYAITGAILSFHFSKGTPEVSQYSLYLPLLLSIGLAVFFLWSARLAWHLRNSISTSAKTLGLQFKPEGIVLVLLCLIFGIVLSIVSAGLAWYLLCF